MKVQTRWLAVLAALILTGCGDQGAAPKQNGDRVQMKTTPAEQRPHRGQVDQVRNPNVQVRAPKVNTGDGRAPVNANQEAEKIANTVSRIPGVEQAAVLVAGKTALVGIDLKANITGSKIDTIKYSVKEAVERSGKGYNAVVSADLDTVTRARALVNDIQNGRPLDAISNEIADIVSRLIPEM
jgi:YhcN/YlaJ family sporulation lipoprotein